MPYATHMYYHEKCLTREEVAFYLRASSEWDYNMVNDAPKPSETLKKELELEGSQENQNIEASRPLHI